MSGKNSVMLDAEKGEARARLGEDYRRMVLIASEAFVKMMESLNAFGSAGFTMFYMMGQEKGRYDVLKEIETLRQHEISFTKRQLLDNIIRQFRVTGWGVPRVQKYDEKRGALMILVENNPLVIVLETQEKSEKPVCYYFRGYWVGVVSEVWERKVSCSETKCMGMGDPYCEFKITPIQ
ncbi:MAG: 4-vinyl reductase [Candidatus Bathyarchaeota archaeon]|nr:4-vinyl reductase [Candidatus Bathyarchaeota archaeon]